MTQSQIGALRADDSSVTEALLAMQRQGQGRLATLSASGDTMKTRLLRDAIFLTLGGSLAIGCGEKDDTAETDTSTDTDTDTDTDGLPDVPAGEYPECDEATAKFGKQCCVDVYCYSPGTDCPAAEDIDQSEVSGHSLGSGECSCSVPEGPYSSDGTGQDGDCCYLIGIEGCEGRPLVVAGGLRKAAVVRRSDWAAGA